MGQPPYLLYCNSCHWSSSQIGMTFEKPVGLAHQVLEQETASRETVEIDRLQSHFDHYIHRLTQSLERQASLTAPRVKKSSAGKPFASGRGKYSYGARVHTPKPAPQGLPTPTRYIGNITAAAAARNKNPESPLHSGTMNSRFGGQPGVLLPAPISEDPNEYRPKLRWRDVARYEAEDGMLRRQQTGQRKNTADDSLVFDDDDEEDQTDDRKLHDTAFESREREQVAEMMNFKGDVCGEDSYRSGFASLERLWDQPWAQPRSRRSQRPVRTPLLAKRAKRCPECSHTLIRPESKPQSTRFKIKVAAMTYLPGVEVGARRLLELEVQGEEDSEGWRKGMTEAIVASGKREKLNKALTPGRIYTYQLALTNPLLESITVTLNMRHTMLSGLIDRPEDFVDVWFPHQEVHIGAFGETLDEVIKDTKVTDAGENQWVEEEESMTKVAFFVRLDERLLKMLPPGVRNLDANFDLNLVFTYTAEEEYENTATVGDGSTSKHDESTTLHDSTKADIRKGKPTSTSIPELRKVEKTFSFDVRVKLGEILAVE
ncbi:hypothetical protein QFC21_001663 [Naganishia friedmannii]|uniref:Uncharacterized protein n=1 Tax=Naganishia friedmannii TaxID=89922 RepID=A0ACC2W0P1_9TREE|nr:hypothetical protein QFC21_001663 [Naganishia friedmannii]